MPKDPNKFSHAGYSIKIIQDEDAESPDDQGNTDLFLVTTSNREFEVKRDGFDADAIHGGELPEGYDIFPLYAYVHSGIALSVSRSGQFADRWDSGQIGFVLVSKTGGFEDSYKAADSLCDEWNQYLRGDVWGYIIEDHGEERDALWGMWGYDYCVTEAKAEAERLRATEDEENIKIDAMMAC